MIQRSLLAVASISAYEFNRRKLCFTSSADQINETRNGIQQAVGKTPLFYLSTLSATLGCHIYAKGGDIYSYYHIAP